MSNSTLVNNTKEQFLAMGVVLNVSEMLAIKLNSKNYFFKLVEYSTYLDHQLH